jgi:sialidase-1
LAFIENRINIQNNDGGYINVTLRRSMDNGQTWTGQQIIATDGTNTFSNGAVVVDSVTSKIFLLAGWGLAGDSEDAVDAGTSVDTRHIYLISSSDSGTNWTTPQDITASVKSPGWGWYDPGPPNGIQLSSGRLLIPAYHSIGYNYYPNAIFSDDHGTSWHVGGSMTNVAGYNECSFVELTNGAIMMNARNDRGEFSRGVAISSDSGASWTAITNDPTLIEPGCEASIIRYTSPPGYYKSRLLFSNPAYASGRHLLTVRVSYNEGQTWAVSKIYCGSYAGYSSLAILPNGEWAVLCENGTNSYYDKITFISDSLSNLTAGADVLDPNTNSPPTLSILPSGTNILVSWPSSAVGFFVQKNPGLTAGNWTDVGVSAVATSNNVNYLLLPPTNNTVFFRLEAR